jgi:hypothetical protein
MTWFARLTLGVLSLLVLARAASAQTPQYQIYFVQDDGTVTPAEVYQPGGGAAPPQGYAQGAPYQGGYVAQPAFAPGYGASQGYVGVPQGYGIRPPCCARGYDHPPAPPPPPPPPPPAPPPTAYGCCAPAPPPAYSTGCCAPRPPCAPPQPHPPHPPHGCPPSGWGEVTLNDSFFWGGGGVGPEYIAGGGGGGGYVVVGASSYSYSSASASARVSIGGRGGYSPPHRPPHKPYHKPSHKPRH